MPKTPQIWGVSILCFFVSGFRYQVKRNGIKHETLNLKQKN